MTFSTDPPLISDLSLIPNADEKADLNAPAGSGGKLVIGQAPNITITETNVVADAAERLALDVQEGDVAIQTNVSTSFIFTGGDNVAPNWQALDFDAVGAIAGEDIAPGDVTASGDMSMQDLTVAGAINGADTATAAAGEALTSDGTGGFSFASAGGIETAATFADLPTPSPPQIGYVETEGQYYVSKDNIGAFDLSTASFDNYQYSLSSPFDLSTASFDNVTLSTQDGVPLGMALSNDGTAMFEVGFNSKLLYQYSLSSPFDLSTASFDNVTLSTQDGNPTGMAFSNDGTAMFEVGSDSHLLYQYSLSSPFDLSTASFDNVTLSTQDGNPRGMAFSNDGTAMFEVGSDSNLFYQYSLPTSNEWEVLQ